MTGTQRQQWQTVAEQFGVDLEQVRRVHVTSPSRGRVADRIESALRRGLNRSLGRPTWRPALTATTGVHAPRR